MITLTVKHEEYLQVVKFKQPLIVVRPAASRPMEQRFARRNPKAKKREPLPQPLKLVDMRTGEIHELKSVETGCGIREGEARLLQWRDDDLGRPRGGVTVVATKVHERSDGKFEVTFESKPEPLGSELLLAPVTGYTGNPAETIDDEAPAFSTPETDRVIADERAARQAAARARLRATAEEVETMEIAKRHKDRIKREIEKALEGLGEEAA